MLREKAKGNPNIIFTGFISGDILNEMYSNAYAITLPSDLEGMSLSLLEALAYGNALVCSDIPENTSVAEDKAIYFKKSDTDDLASKLQYICDNEEKVAELKSVSSDFITGKYNWDDIARSTYNLYEEVGRKGRK